MLLECRGHAKGHRGWCDGASTGQTKVVLMLSSCLLQLPGFCLVLGQWEAEFGLAVKGHHLGLLPYSPSGRVPSIGASPLLLQPPLGHCGSTSAMAPGL